MRVRPWMKCSVVIGVIVLANLAWSAGQGPKPKLPAPTNVLCPVVGDNVAVSADAVPGANTYQVWFLGVTSEGEVLEETNDPTEDPSDLVPLDDFVSLTVRMRALPPPKKANQPPQAGGPKSKWSEPCVVVLPVPL